MYYPIIKESHTSQTCDLVVLVHVLRTNVSKEGVFAPKAPGNFRVFYGNLECILG